MKPWHLLIFVLILVPLGRAEAATITTCPGQCGGYSDIQDAVNSASPGDTVILGPGVYRESVILNKSITLQGSEGETFLYGVGPDPVLRVEADDVHISGVWIGYSLIGVEAVGVEGLRLSGSVFVNCSFGVVLESCSMAEVRDCEFHDALYEAVRIIGSANATVSGLHVRGGLRGVSVLKSNACTVAGSSFEDLGRGVNLEESHGCTIQGNVFLGCDCAVLLSESSGNVLHDNVAGGGCFAASFFSSRNVAKDNRVNLGLYAYDSQSLNNVYAVGPVNVTGHNYMFGPRDAPPPPGYEALHTALNITFIPDPVEGGYAWLSYWVPEEQFAGRDPEDLRLYEVSGAHPRLVASGAFFNGSVTLEARLTESGLYSVLLWRDTGRPVAVIEVSGSALVGDSLRFDGSGSTDDVGVVAYRWSFGDGGEAEGETVEHVYSAPGSYTVALTVQDLYGNVGEAAITLTVVEPEADVGRGYLLYVFVGVVILSALLFQFLRERRFIVNERSGTPS